MQDCLAFLFLLGEQFPALRPFLPEHIHFIHAEELRECYPGLSPKERENKIAEKYGVVFIRGISVLKNATVEISTVAFLFI